MIFKRMMLKVLRLIVLLAFVCWIGNALSLFLSSGFYSGSGGGARAYLAMHDGLLEVPRTLIMIFNFLAGLVQSAHSTLVAQLGYDPLDTIRNLFRNLLPSVPQPGPSSTNPIHSIYPAIPSMIRMAVGLSIAQFVLLFLLSTIGARIGWRHPGVPIVYNIGIKLLYFAVVIGIAFWLASLAFKTGVFPGTMAILVAVLLIYIPLLSGLPLWLLSALLPRLFKR